MLEINGEAKFVPGRVTEDKNGKIKFIAGEVIETEEGFKFVCDAQNVDGEWEFSFQGLEVGTGINVGVDLENMEDKRKPGLSAELKTISENDGSGEESGRSTPVSKRKRTGELKLIVGSDLKELPVQELHVNRSEVLSVTPAIGEIIQESGEDQIWSDEVKLKMRVHESGPTVTEGSSNGFEQNQRRDASGGNAVPMCCVIIKNNLETIVPKDGASKILSGEARYSVIDETGIRFFEPKIKHKLELKSFSEEMLEIDVNIRGACLSVFIGNVVICDPHLFQTNLT